MNISTPAFIDFTEIIMDKIDFCNVGAREVDDALIYKLDDIDDYDGPAIGVSFKISSGLLYVDVFSEDREATDKFVTTFDDADPEYVVSSINSMIIDVLTEKEEEPEAEEEDFNEKLDFESIFNIKEPVEEPNEEVLVCKVYLDHDGKPFILFDENHSSDGSLSCWVPGEGHSSVDPYYPDECKVLSKKDPIAKETIAAYENGYSTNGKTLRLEVLPEGELLPVQKETHKEIFSKD